MQKLLQVAKGSAALRNDIGDPLGPIALHGTHPPFTLGKEICLMTEDVKACEKINREKSWAVMCCKEFVVLSPWLHRKKCLSNSSCFSPFFRIFFF